MKKTFLSIVASIAMACPLMAVEQSSAMEVGQSLVQACIDQDTIAYISCVSPGIFAKSVKNKALNNLFDSLHQKMEQAYQGCSASQKKQILAAVAAQIAPQTVSLNGKWYLGKEGNQYVDHSSAQAVAACLVWSCFTGNAEVALECFDPSQRAALSAEMGKEISKAQRMFEKNMKALPLKEQLPKIYNLVSNMQEGAKEINGKWYISAQ